LKKLPSTKGVTLLVIVNSSLSDSWSDNDPAQQQERDEQLAHRLDGRGQR
jgi:hypothetical protein